MFKKLYQSDISQMAWKTNTRCKRNPIFFYETLFTVFTVFHGKNRESLFLDQNAMAKKSEGTENSNGFFVDQ